MQFEDFDSKIKQAADQHHPNYDETAWTKMEKLLDRHLPQKEDRRRRFIFFILLFLLLGGGAFMLINKPWQQDRLVNPQADQKTSSTSDAIETKDETTRNSQGISLDKKQEGSTKAEPAIEYPVTAKNGNTESPSVVVSNPVKNGPAIRLDKKNIKQKSYTSREPLGNTNKKDEPTGNVTNIEKTRKETIPSERTGLTASIANSDKKKPVSDDETKNDRDLPAHNDAAKTVSIKNDTTSDKQPAAPDVKTLVKKSRSKKTNSFFFSVSAGPDVSSIGIDKPGKTKLLVGASLGYTFKDRWTLRTGFYSGSKLYSASPGEYKPPTPMINVAYLKKIDADCKVYEIPLSLAYNFSRTQKHKFFAAAGLSSYIMKKETYVYEYKYPGAGPVYYPHTVKNENKHFFSVLSLSAGYQRRINRTFSITAEPYFKLPLAGVGYGRIKLNSAGILFSLNVSPFQGAPKK
jgi:hypothetical protein